MSLKTTAFVLSAILFVTLRLPAQCWARSRQSMIALKKMAQRNGDCYDMVVDMESTSPFRTVKNLEDVIELQWQNRFSLT